MRYTGNNLHPQSKLAPHRIALHQTNPMRALLALNLDVANPPALLLFLNICPCSCCLLRIVLSKALQTNKQRAWVFFTCSCICVL